MSKDNDLIQKAILERHSVRSYTKKELDKNTILMLQNEIKQINAKSGLSFKLVLNEPRAFRRSVLGLAQFSNVKNYIMLIGPDNHTVCEKVGYYGEQLVLKAQMEGLNTCWVGGSFARVPDIMATKKGEKLYCIITVGYGKNNGRQHRSKSYEAVVVGSNHPKWFKDGVEAALLAPTAFNSQNFTFELKGDSVLASASDKEYDQIGLGIVKYHFEIGSGRKI
jgi:nitroreductase